MFRIPHTCPCRPLLFRFPWILQKPDTRLHMFRIRYIFPCLQRQPIHSLHDNCFRGTDVNACLAVDAHFLVDFRFFVLYGDSWSGTLIYTGLASGTFTVVNDCNQLVHSIVYVGEKIKNRFRCEHDVNKLQIMFFFKLKAWKTSEDNGGSQSCAIRFLKKSIETDYRSCIPNQRIFINDIDENRVGLIWRITSRIFPFVMNAAAPEGTPPRRIS